MLRIKIQGACPPGQNLSRRRTVHAKAVVRDWSSTQ